jgi:glycosyltransferase involved in cell wall biosynthesis
MRIVHLAAGAGPMYCGACKRDVALARALRDLGHEVLVVPLYTPLRLEDPQDVPIGPLGFGGIRAFLAGSRAFRLLPRRLRRALDHPFLVRLATSRAKAVDASRLGALTVGVLQGLGGPQSECWEALEEVLRGLPKPDWVTITNSMLSAAAEVVERVWGVPCAAYLQGEETFLDSLGDPYREQAWGLVRGLAARCERLLPTSRSGAAWWKARLGLEEDRFAVVPPCLADAGSVAVAKPPEERRVACVGVLAPAKGQDLLVAAAANLAPSGGWSFVIAGRKMDAAYGRRLLSAARAAGPRGKVRVLGELDPWSRRWLQATAGIGCVPSRIPEARGLVALEFLSYGVPTVVPDIGVFPEVAERVDGTVLFRSGSAEALQTALESAARPEMQEATERVRRAARMREEFSPERAAEALLKALGSPAAT